MTSDHWFLSKYLSCEQWDSSKKTNKNIKISPHDLKQNVCHWRNAKQC